MTIQHSCTGERNLPIRVAFVPEAISSTPGRLGMTFAPGKKDGWWNRDLATDLARLRDVYHTDRLVSLVEQHELRMLQIEPLVERATALGIEVIRFPIVDVSIPELDPALELAHDLIAGLRAGRCTVVHCRGGIGRAGTIAACTLVAGGASVDGAIVAVRAARPGTIETDEQERFVSSFGEAWPAFLARSDRAEAQA